MLRIQCKIIRAGVLDVACSAVGLSRLDQKERKLEPNSVVCSRLVSRIVEHVVQTTEPGLGHRKKKIFCV